MKMLHNQESYYLSHVSKQMRAHSDYEQCII